MDRVLIFAGTTEGRELASYLSRHKVTAHVCVATEYGEKLLIEEEGITVHTGRMDAEGMVHLIEKERITLVIDATHPYAVEVTNNITKACLMAKTERIRLMRDSLSEFSEGQSAGKTPEIVRVPSVDSAVAYLSHTEGKILVTTGSKELKKFTELKQFEERVYTRILCSPEVMQESMELGFSGKNLIGMQGPFSEELNYAMLRQTGASYLVTKESGAAGGFPEKMCAAAKAGVTVVLIGRPAQDEGFSIAEVKRLLKKRFDFTDKREISIVGIGMGNPMNMTREAYQACQDAQVLIGAKRILETVAALKKQVFAAYKEEEISRFATLHPEYEKIGILVSGDIGFYSGARKLISLFEGDEIKVYSGISSVVYFCGKLHTSWEDAYLMSLHGRRQNLLSAVQRHKKVFALSGEEGGITRICEKLCLYGLSGLRISVGENLSYENERIVTGTVSELKNQHFEKLSVLLIRNPKASSVVTHGIEDESFLRAKVPMTKSEVRSISLSKLRLRADSVIYDVGAGTGSVAVEMALRSYDGMVYAIEKKEGAAELIRENKRRFQTDNLEVVEGTAPGALVNLPAPTHVFIGGSSGNLREILKIVLAKNSLARIVINAIALETLSECLACIKTLLVTEVDIAQISVGKSQEIGGYHMMMGNNPVYVISFQGGERP